MLLIKLKALNRLSNALAELNFTLHKTFLLRLGKIIYVYN
jgi:hypothetical protein